MSQLFRKEVMERRSRALFGDVVLRSPFPIWATTLLILVTIGLILYLLFGVGMDGQTVWSWLRG